MVWVTVPPIARCAGVLRVQRVGQPGPADPGQQRVGGEVDLQLGGHVGDQPQGALPGLVPGRVVQQDQPAGGHLVAVAQHRARRARTRTAPAAAARRPPPARSPAGVSADRSPATARAKVSGSAIGGAMPAAYAAAGPPCVDGAPDASRRERPAVRRTFGRVPFRSPPGGLGGGRRGTIAAMTTDTTGTAARDGQPRPGGPADSPFVRACRRRAGPAHPGLVHAPGRPVAAGVPGDPGRACRCWSPAAGPELVTEITLQPVRRHGVDAAILFSDIVVPLAAAGVDLDIVPGTGPVVAEPVRTAADVERIRPIAPRRRRRTWTRRSGCWSPSWATPR